jgi:hypothetical protein
MPPVSSENSALQQALAEATARLRAEIRQDIAALNQAINESQQLVQDLQRERAIRHPSRVVDAVRAPIPPDKQVAND